MSNSAEVDVWAELGAGMRALRTNRGLSLRQVETASRWGRGTLSQVENGKARPATELVAWYDEHLGGDGLLSTIYSEARCSGQRLFRRTGRAPAVVPGDGFRIDEVVPPSGTTVAAGSTVEVSWTLSNTGSVTWAGRLLTRFGTVASPRLITSDPACAIPTCEPGQYVKVRQTVTAPERATSVIAYWHITDGEGRPSFPGEPMLAVCLAVT